MLTHACLFVVFTQIQEEELNVKNKIVGKNLAGIQSKNSPVDIKHNYNNKKKNTEICLNE